MRILFQLLLLGPIIVCAAPYSAVNNENVVNEALAVRSPVRPGSTPTAERLAGNPPGPFVTGFAKAFGDGPGVGNNPFVGLPGSGNGASLGAELYGFGQAQCSSYSLCASFMSLIQGQSTSVAIQNTPVPITSSTIVQPAMTTPTTLPPTTTPEMIPIPWTTTPSGTRAMETITMSTTAFEMPSKPTASSDASVSRTDSLSSPSQATLITSSLSSSSIPSLGAQTQNSSTSFGQKETKTIVGASIGGSVAVFALAGLLYLGMSRRRRQQRYSREGNRSMSFQSDTSPFIARASLQRINSPPAAYFPVQEPNRNRSSRDSREEKLLRLSYSAYSTRASLPRVDEDSEPPSPLTPPPVVLRAAQLQGEGSSIDEHSVTDLPANLGRLNSWLLENRRRSRAGAEDSEYAVSEMSDG